MGWDCFSRRKKRTVFEVNCAKWINALALTQLNKDYVFHAEIQNKTKWNLLRSKAGVVWCCRRALKGRSLGFRESNVSVMLWFCPAFVFHSRPFAFGRSTVNHTTWYSWLTFDLSAYRRLVFLTKGEISALREKQYHFIKTSFLNNCLLGDLRTSQWWFFEVWDRFSTECKIC